VKGRDPNPHGESLTRRQKRVFAVVGVIVLAVVAGVGIWSASDPGSYGRSGNGCINVTMPSTTGAGLMHGCGAVARSMCRHAVTHHDQLARLTLAQCRIADLVPAASPRGSGAP
jgi:hypothetical protein